QYVSFPSSLHYFSLLQSFLSFSQFFFFVPPFINPSFEPEDEIKDEKNPRPLDEVYIALLKTYGLGPYSMSVKKVEKEIKEMEKKVNDLCGIKESDTGLAAPSQWDLVSNKQMMQEEQPLQVLFFTKVAR
ncbi:hypothetical protein ES288_D08G098400v1, partial [Gossypium darwinii]